MLLPQLVPQLKVALLRCCGEQDCADIVSNDVAPHV
jgi:hypothetical protein